MAYLLDTNIVIHLIEAEPATVDRVATFQFRPSMSVVTKVELAGGLARAGAAPGLRARINAVSSVFDVVEFDDGMAEAYAAIVEAAGFSRVRILDRMIAAQAIRRDLTLVTMNGGDFADVPGLKVEVWASPNVV